MLAITDRVANLSNAANTGSVTATPSPIPLRLKVGGVWRPAVAPWPVAAINADGTFSLQLPWPSETHASGPVSWSLPLAHGVWSGVPPEGLTGAALDDLLSHGWSLTPA